MNTVDKQTSKFSSIYGISQWVFWIFVALAISSVIAIWSGYAQAELLNRAISGETVTLAEVVSNDSREALAGIIYLVLYL